MDPNKLLSDLLNHAKSFLALDGDVADPVALDAFCQALLDLDSWLTRGGFLPERWAKMREQDLEGLQRAISDTQAALQDLQRALGGPK
jgi:hypothetical protein